MSLLAVVLLGGNAAGGPVAALVATLAGPRAVRPGLGSRQARLPRWLLANEG
jgi:hypothetical protein